MALFFFKPTQGSRQASAGIKFVVGMGMAAYTPKMIKSKGPAQPVNGKAANKIIFASHN
jgi:hypothetical protein